MRKLHLQIIRTADDDGSNPAAISASGVVPLVTSANDIYATAGVEFVYDPARDFTHVNSTLLNRSFTPLSDLTKATSENEAPAVTAVPHVRARAADLGTLQRSHHGVLLAKEQAVFQHCQRPLGRRARK